MQEAIIAALNTQTFPNPKVGAVLVDKFGNIKSTGVHHGPGTNHAEIEIINNSVITEEDTLYVTLEPCFHTDSSPSCCAELLKTPIKNIVIGDIDIDIRTNGKSIELLKKNSESALKARITDNEELMEKIADRENELADRIARVDELEGLIARQKKAMVDLKEKLSAALLNFEDKGLRVEARDGKVYVSMENKLLFKSGSWAIEPEGQLAISSLGKVLADNPDISILIEGHTDNIPYSGRGSLKGNWDLSTKRATSIVNTLLKNIEILPQNLTAAGRGEYLPIATNSTREGRATNRRIEVILSPQLDEITQIINTLD